MLFGVAYHGLDQSGEQAVVITRAFLQELFVRLDAGLFNVNELCGDGAELFFHLGIVDRAFQARRRPGPV